MIDSCTRSAIARRFREIGDELGMAAPLWYHTAKALGVRTSVGGKSAFGMIADLIDPSDTSRTCRDNVACDREALLKIADEIAESDVDGVVDWPGRIREACGE